MLAIHDRTGNFSDKWLEYCHQHNLSYKLVNCYSSDIIDQIKECDGLMWHWQHGDFRAQIAAREIILSIEQHGIPVYPNYRTCWHYDDKIAQKYLIESIGAPLVPHMYSMKLKKLFAGLRKLNGDSLQTTKGRRWGFECTID